MRILKQILALASLLLALAAAPALAGQSVLNKSTTVRGDVIRLGDLFTNAGKYAGKTVAYTPQPGKRAIFDARWLYRVARGHGLDWRPMSRLDQATVERDSLVIGREEITDYVLAALLDKGADPDMLVDLGNRRLRLYVPAESSATVAVEDTTYDQRTRRFTAILVAPADDPSAQRVRVSGKLHQMSEIPVLSRRVLKDEIITKRDIKWIRTRSDRLQKDTLTNIADLVGKTPKRGLRAGYPVRISQVRRPLLVTKGSLVTLVLRVPNMLLTAKGRALDGGSDGDTIRISNSQSNTIVEAVITGFNKVSVRPLNRIAMN